MTLTLPTWTRTLPNDARLNAKELAVIMGCTRKKISRMMLEGKFPKADGCHHKSNCGARKDRYLWSMKILREIESTQREALLP